MNLNMIRPKNETEDLLLSKLKNCQTLIEQTHRKAEETLEFKMIKPKETFHSNPPVQTKGDWMLEKIGSKLDPGNHTIEDLQKSVHPFGDHEGTLQFEYDDLNKKAKLI